MCNNPFVILLFSCLATFSLGVAAAESTDAPSVPAEQVQTPSGQVDLNTADAATLDAGLLGVGPAKAQAIIDHRNSNGPFASVDELLEVKGIGAAILEKNRERIRVN